MIPKRSPRDLRARQLKMTRPLLLLLLTVVLLLGGSEAYDPEASITGLYTGPYFDPLAPRNMTAHLGDEATLPCTVRQLGDKSVSWVRMRDADILTVDRYTFVGDERFESHYSTTTETWNLVIKYVQERDAGLYECQVSTEPKMSQLFSLRVVIPKVVIVPVGDRYVKAGSTVRVDCQITDVVQIPDYIFWYHEDKRVMDRRDPNLLVTVKRTGVEAMTSTFTIHKVRQEQSGNYTCMPSNLHAASVTLHVLNEKHPAAMQGERNDAGAVEAKIHITLVVLLFVLICSVSFGLNEESNESAAKKRTLDLSSSSSSESPVVSSSSSSSSSSSGSILTTDSFTSPNHHALSAIVFDGEEPKTSPVLRELLKIDVLHLAKEVLAQLEGQGAGVEEPGQLSPLAPVGAGDTCLGAPTRPHLARTREILGLKGHPLTYFRQRQEPRVEALDEGSAQLCKGEEDVGGATLQMNHTEITTDPSQQLHQQDSSVVVSNTNWSFGRWASVVRCR